MPNPRAVGELSGIVRTRTLRPARHRELPLQLSEHVGSNGDACPHAQPQLPITPSSLHVSLGAAQDAQALQALQPPTNAAAGQEDAPEAHAAGGSQSADMPIVSPASSRGTARRIVSSTRQACLFAHVATMQLLVGWV
jgi:hypothetical protein